MNFKKIKSFFMLAAIMLAFSATGQDVNQAADIFNQGNQGVKDNNYQLAIDKYQEAMDMASQLGPEGEQIVAGAKSQIPSLYYKIGIADYKDKNIDKAVGEFEKAIEYATQYNDPETAAKATDIIPKLYYSQGNSFYSDEKYNEALESFGKSAELAPDYSRAYWGMALVYNKIDDTEKMKESFAKALELAEGEGDADMAKKVRANASKLLQSEGAKKLQAQDWPAALMCLNATTEFEPENAEAYYYIALANNGLKKYDEAIAAADKGLEVAASESADFKAKFYYEKGNALKAQGNNDAACDAYQNAKHGQFVQNADYEIKTVLKCN
ncbi:MAG TPA: tetratricopeptide repeat protein [Bacteroidales bacterium]|nr:tetratricopeptide repeat protein [Bacteroidales bacterium]